MAYDSGWLDDPGEMWMPSYDRSIPANQQEPTESLADWMIKAAMMQEAAQAASTGGEVTSIPMGVGPGGETPNLGGGMADLLGNQGGNESARYGYAGHGLGGYGTGTPTDVYGYSSPNAGYLESKAKGLGLGMVENMLPGLIAGAPIENVMNSVAGTLASQPTSIVNDLAGMYSQQAGLTQSPGTIGPFMESLASSIFGDSKLGKMAGGFLQGAPAQIASTVSPFGGIGLGFLDAALSLANPNLDSLQKQAGMFNFITNAAIPALAGMTPMGPVGYMAAKALGPMMGYLGQLGAYNLGIPGIVDPGLFGVDPKTGGLTPSALEAVEGYKETAATQKGTMGGAAAAQGWGKYGAMAEMTRDMVNAAEAKARGEYSGYGYTDTACPDVRQAGEAYGGTGLGAGEVGTMGGDLSGRDVGGLGDSSGPAGEGAAGGGSFGGDTPEGQGQEAGTREGPGTI